MPVTIFTVVDRTLNEWTEWQLKNLNAIVWLYRGEVDKYMALLNEYRSQIESIVIVPMKKSSKRLLIIPFLSRDGYKTQREC